MNVSQTNLIFPLRVCFPSCLRQLQKELVRVDNVVY